MRISPVTHLLNDSGIRFAFYFNTPGQDPVLESNCEKFSSASIIKVPILLAWVHLERTGAVTRHELCNLDAEKQVHGAGFGWMMYARQLPYHDVLLMMMANSDNLCTNLVIQRIGLDRLNQVFTDTFGFQNTAVQRKLMDYEARARGLDNWISPQDCIRFYDLFQQLTDEEKAWVEPILKANTDDLLLKRNIPRDELDFYHKTGSIVGVLHDWGYTRACEIFLLTQEVKNEPAVFEIFGKAGELMLEAEANVRPTG